MRCEKCGMQIPEDSEFCQYCGNKTELNTPLKEAMANTIPQSEAPIKCGPQPDIAEPRRQEEETNNTVANLSIEEISLQVASLLKDKKGAKSKSREKPARKRILFTVLFIVCVLLLGCLNVVQYTIYRSNQKTIATLKSSEKDLTTRLSEKEKTNSELSSLVDTQKKIIAEKTDTIKANEKTISNQKSWLATYQTESEYYSTLCSALRSGNIGYAANNFNCSPSIILVSVGESKKVKLTANWSNWGTVSYVCSPKHIASVDFDEDSWSTSTKLSITGLKTGITVVTFSNNIDSKTFKLIIVVE